MKHRSASLPSRRGGSSAAVALALLAASLVSGCSFSWGEGGIRDVFFGATPAEDIAGAEDPNAPAQAPAPREEDTGSYEDSSLRRIAIMPVAYSDGSGGQPCDVCPSSVEMKPTSARAARLATGFLYEAIARHPRFLFPTAESVEKALAAAPNRSMISAASQLAASGRADVVVVFALLELRPRVGPDNQPDEPAGVAMYASLVDARSGAVLWSDTFDRNEKGRGTVLGAYDKVINDAPIRWKTAEAYSEVAVDDLVDDLVDELD